MQQAETGHSTAEAVGASRKFGGDTSRRMIIGGLAALPVLACSGAAVMPRGWAGLTARLTLVEQSIELTDDDDHLDRLCDERDRLIARLLTMPAPSVAAVSEKMRIVLARWGDDLKIIETRWLHPIYADLRRLGGN